MSTKKKRQIRNRVLAEAEYILKTHATIRETAKHFGVSKSTVWTDMTERLFCLDENGTYLGVSIVLISNLSERSKRGGAATRKLWEERRKARERS